MGRSHGTERGVAMSVGSSVLLTVHGIGFQQPPENGRAGYADELHRRLKSELADLLGDDPERGEGPVYVSSEVGSGLGLARLEPGRPLAPTGRIAHVALVYSPSEPLTPALGPVAAALERAMSRHRRYTNVRETLRLVFDDAWATVRETRQAAHPSTLSPRSDSPVAHAHRDLIGRLLYEGKHHDSTPPVPPAQPHESYASGILRALEADVATYVVLSDMRERVRGFVQEAMQAILDRPDTAGLVVNAHSQGTVVCWDALRALPFFSWRDNGDRRASTLRHLVTAGSPIRKYVDLWGWGGLVGQLAAVLEDRGQGPRWSNFWDPRDPIADPLNPASGWRPGEPLHARGEDDLGLLVGRRPGGGPAWHVEVDDRKVDNLRGSAGGGLKAHDYWDNQSEFVVPLAELLRPGR